MQVIQSMQLLKLHMAWSKQDMIKNRKKQREYNSKHICGWENKSTCKNNSWFKRDIFISVGKGGMQELFSMLKFTKKKKKSE